MKKLLFIIIFLAFNLLPAELYYDQWEQTTELTANEQKNKITVILRAELPAQQYHNSWSYIFNYNAKIKINYVRLNGRPTKYEFLKNELKIDLGRLFDKQSQALSFEYQEENQYKNAFYIQQYVTIPYWLSETPLNLKIILADEYLSCSRHPKFKQSKNIFFFNGKIPADGLQELFIYTPHQTDWQIEKSYTLNGNNSKKDFTFYFPKLGETGDSTLISYLVESSQTPQKIDDQQNNHVYILKDSGTIELKIKANFRKRPGEENYLPPQEGLLIVDPEVELFLKNLARKILDKKTGETLPLHIKLAEWVHSYLTYDKGFAGKEQSVLQILERRRGVCQHYSKLYLQLCRAAKIPAVEVSGLAYSATDPAGQPNWGNHSWVIVNINNQWLPIDPTWNLTGGILPSSHVALYYPAKNTYSYRAENYYDRLVVKEKIEISELK